MIHFIGRILLATVSKRFRFSAEKIVQDNGVWQAPGRHIQGSLSIRLDQVLWFDLAPETKMATSPQVSNHGFRKNHCHERIDTGRVRIEVTLHHEPCSYNCQSGQQTPAERFGIFDCAITPMVRLAKAERNMRKC